MSEVPEAEPILTSRKRVKEKPDVLVSSLKVTRVSPWSFAFNSFLASMVLAVVLTILTVIVWYGFNSMGVFDKIVNTLAPEGKGADTLHSWLSLNKFIMIGGSLSAALIVIIPVFAFFAAGVFNLIAKFTGGVRLNLSNRRMS